MRSSTIRLITLFILLLTFTASRISAQEVPANREIMRLGRGRATSLDWRPDGEVLAVGSSSGVWFFDTQFEQIGYIEYEAITSVKWKANDQSILIVTEDNTAEIWSLSESFSLVKRFELPAEGQLFSWSPDGKWIAVEMFEYSNGGTYALVILNVETGAQTTLLSNLTYWPHASWNVDSLSIVVRGGNHTLDVLDILTGEKLSTYWSDNTTTHISSFVFTGTPDEIFILNAWDTNLYVWNMKTNQVIHKQVQKYNDCLPYALKASKNSATYICSGMGGAYDVLTVSTSPAHTYAQSMQDQILSYDWQPNTSSVTILYKKGLLQSWSPQIAEVKDYQLFIPFTKIVWSPDSKHVAAISGNYGEDFAYPVAIWSVDRAASNIAIPQPNSVVYPFAAPKWARWKDNSTLLTYSDTQTFPTALCFIYRLESWNAETAELGDFAYENGICGIDDLPTNWSYVVEWTDDFSLVAYTSGTDSIKISPTTPYEPAQISLKTALSVQSLFWSSDNNHLIAQGLDRHTTEPRIEVWDIQTGTQLKTIQIPLDNQKYYYSRSPVWSPDGNHFAITTSADDESTEIGIFAANGDLQFTYKPGMRSTILAWSPDGQKLAVDFGNSSHVTIQVIDPLTGKIDYSYENTHSNLEWSANSKYLIYPLWVVDKIVIVDVNNRRDLIKLDLASFPIITVSPDNTLLALAMDDGTIRIWDVADLLAN